LRVRKSEANLSHGNVARRQSISVHGPGWEVGKTQRLEAQVMIANADKPMAKSLGQFHGR